MKTAQITETRAAHGSRSIAVPAFSSRSCSIMSTAHYTTGSNLSTSNYEVLRADRTSALPLGNTTNKVSNGPYHKYTLFNTVRSVLAGYDFRIHDCMRAIGPEVSIVRSGERLHFRGIAACNSIWLCPICSSKISSQRASMLQSVFSQTSAYPVMITFTLSHTLSDDLVDLLSTLNQSLRLLKSGRWWKTFQEQFGVIAFVTSLEIRYSRTTGWHPHKHMLLFLLDGHVDLASLEQQLRNRYTELVDNIGGYASAYHGVNVLSGDQVRVSYIAKWSTAAELTLASAKSSKSSISPWELAQLAPTHPWASKRFIEYAHATYGVRALTWSHHAKENLGVDPDLDLNQDKVEPEQLDEVIINIPSSTWKLILAAGLQETLLMIATYSDVTVLTLFINSIASRSP